MPNSWSTDVEADNHSRLGTATFGAVCHVVMGSLVQCMVILTPTLRTVPTDLGSFALKNGAQKAVTVTSRASGSAGLPGEAHVGHGDPVCQRGMSAASGTYSFAVGGCK